jgi:hypothetical protein
VYWVGLAVAEQVDQHLDLTVGPAVGAKFIPFDLNDMEVDEE